MEMLIIFLCAFVLVASKSDNLTEAPSIMLECASNNETCSNFTSTIAPSTKIASNESLDVWKFDENIAPAYYKYTPSERTRCHCDLQTHFCDINCCCDPDCSVEAKKVFSKCEEVLSKERKINYCNYMQYVYNNRVLHEIEVHQNSLFCVMKTNLPAHYFEQKRQVFANPLNAYEVIAKSPTYEWANSVNDSKTQFEQNGNFSNYQPTFGDQLFILRNYSTPVPFELPASFITPDCVRMNAIEYLMNFNARCRQSVNNLNHQLTVEYYSKNITFLSSLRYLNLSINTYEGCPKNVCVPISLVRICAQHSCHDHQSNDIVTQCTQKSCSNVVTNVEFHFYHNATLGVQKVHLDLVVANITLPCTYIEQQFTVKYLWLNQTRLNYSEFRSGNPGYISGEPILISTMITTANRTIVTHNITANATKMIYSKYLQTDDTNYLENFLVLPKNVNGKCILSNITYQPVEFEYNMITKCSHVQGYVSNNQSNSSIVNTCRILQNNILAYWSLSETHFNETMRYNKTFAHFGNANRSRLDDWEYFLYDVYPDELLDGNLGRILDRSNIECRNICTRIKFNIFYERVEDNQNRVAAIYVEFLNLQTVHLKIVQNRIFVNVMLTGEVMFYDVTASRNLKYVSPPSLDIKLPHDFFYPFVKIAENHSNRLMLHCMYLILMLSVNLVI